MSIVGLTVLILCAVVIWFIVKFENLRKRKSNQLLLNLCMGHLLSGMAYVYGIFSISSIGRYRLSGNMYNTLALVFLSIDRFIFIQYPYHYQTKLSNRVHIGFMLLSPLVYTVYFIDGLILQIKDEKETFAGSFAFVFFTSAAITLVLNISIYITVRKQRKQIRLQYKQLSKTKDGTESTMTVLNVELKNSTRINLTLTNSKSATVSTNSTSSNATSSIATLASANSTSKNPKSTSTNLTLINLTSKDPTSTNPKSTNPTSTKPT